MESRRFCDAKLARAHIVIQKFTQHFSPQEALDKGTLFPELYCPYRYRDDHKPYPHRKGEVLHEPY